MRGRRLSDRLDLSRLRVLRSIQVDNWPRSYGRREDQLRHLLVMRLFSTIGSPVFSELAITLTGRAVTHLPQETELFETLGMMNRLNPFELIFLLDVSDPSYEEARRKLAGVLDLVTARGLLDFLESPPTIRRVGSHHYGRDTTFTDYINGSFN